MEDNDGGAVFDVEHVTTMRDTVPDTVGTSSLQFMVRPRRQCSDGDTVSDSPRLRRLSTLLISIKFADCEKWGERGQRSLRRLKCLFGI
jgi:hypothetical protein